MTDFTPACLLCPPFTYLFKLKAFAWFGFLSFVCGVHADERLDHFENKIRPVLIKHCLECHGDDPDELAGGLSLDSATSVRLGGDNGAAIVPGKPDESLLLRAIRYQDGLDMPPDGRLSASIVSDFEKWIRDGAVDPREGVNPEQAGNPKPQDNSGEDHWAFQPLQESVCPDVGPDSNNAIDAYVDRALRDASLTRSREASPTTILRRLHFDLTGLPPSEETIRDFSKNPTELAYLKVVDRLLSSDDFGRRWGRNWLDVVRYADSNGSDFNATFHHAWRYRDYVIASFDQDKPFDQFVAEQIAGDLMDSEDISQRTGQLVATGFLMLGPKMLSERDKAKLQMDVVDDQIDTIGRAFMGLTLGCARCHDHKFDPIPTSEYYSLAGIFRSTDVLEGEIQKYVSDWIEVPLPVEESVKQRVEKYEEEEKRLAAKLKTANARLKSAELRLAEGDSTVIVDDVAAKKTGQWVDTSYSRPFIGSGYLHDNNRDKGSATVKFATTLSPGNYEVSLAYTAAPNRSRSTLVIVDDGASQREKKIDQTKPPTKEMWASLAEFSLAEETSVSVTISNQSSNGYVIADAVRFSLINAEKAASSRNTSKLAEKVAQLRQEAESLTRSLKLLRANQPEPLPFAMAVRDSKKIEDAFICVRGEVNLKGQTVSRGFLNICQPAPSSETPVAESPAMPTDQSGRLELANWICDPDHPLTSRVIVNRVWMQLIGEGLVRTVDNFGVLGERPTHPELLDHLAITFLKDEWSIKKLVRSIVTSATYRQSTAYDAVAMNKDPENRLLWRMHRKRLPAEAIRDTLLVASGLLDSTPSIAPVSMLGTLVSQNVADPTVVTLKDTYRRGVYVPVIRGQLNELFASFDFADPDLLVGRRERTNVPGQALVLMNSPQIQEYVTAISREILNHATTPQEVVNAAYSMLYARPPEDAEVQALIEYLPSLENSLVQDFVNAIVGSSEFRLLD